MIRWEYVDSPGRIILQRYNQVQKVELSPILNAKRELVSVQINEEFEVALSKDGKYGAGK